MFTSESTFSSCPQANCTSKCRCNFTSLSQTGRDTIARKISELTLKMIFKKHTRELQPGINFFFFYLFSVKLNLFAFKGPIKLFTFYYFPFNSSPLHIFTFIDLFLYLFVPDCFPLFCHECFFLFKHFCLLNEAVIQSCHQTTWCTVDSHASYMWQSVLCSGAGASQRLCVCVCVSLSSR